MERRREMKVTSDGIRCPRLRCDGTLDVVTDGAIGRGRSWRRAPFVACSHCEYATEIRIVPVRAPSARRVPR
jgi:hypothetical protein